MKEENIIYRYVPTDSEKGDNCPDEIIVVSSPTSMGGVMIYGIFKSEQAKKRSPLKGRKTVQSTIIDRYLVKHLIKVLINIV